MPLLYTRHPLDLAASRKRAATGRATRLWGALAPATAYTRPRRYSRFTGGRASSSKVWGSFGARIPIVGPHPLRHRGLAKPRGYSPLGSRAMRAERAFRGSSPP